jgi:hypothetical protein
VAVFEAVMVMCCTAQKGLLAEVEVVKSSDFNVSYRLLTHLGHLLSAGDTVMVSAASM